MPDSGDPGRRLHAAITRLVAIFAFAAGALECRAATFTLLEENDVVFARDEHYSQGLRFVYADRLPEDGSLARMLDHALAPIGRGAARHAFDLSVGQTGFTPENLHNEVPAANDRPYGGWLYAGASLMREHDGRVLDVVELQVGRTGPDSLARQGQRLAHRILGQVQSMGWDHQVAGRTGLIAALDRKWRTGWTTGGGRRIELIPDTGLTFGNLLGYASAGMLVRLSQTERCDYGPLQVRPAYSGATFDCHDRARSSRGWTLFAGSQARYVARNFFIEGPLLAGENTVRAKRLVADLFVGGEIPVIDGWRAGLAITTRTREFEGQRRSDRFGSLSISIDLP